MEVIIVDDLDPRMFKANSKPIRQFVNPYGATRLSMAPGERTTSLDTAKATRIYPRCNAECQP